ncbi:hypothetical protein K501DRAFT_272802 [Backusella circina FSU 941]|nr:hypothetical protein K501DRAFT_272802 [Backusella circina FSU 941]
MWKIKYFFYYLIELLSGKSKGHYSSTLLSGTDAEQYLAAQKHLKTQKQFYEQSNNSRHAPKLPLYYQTQKSFQPSAIPQQSNTIPLSLNPPSFSTTQTVSNSDKSGHNNADSFSIGNELDQLLTVQRGSEKQVEPLSEASSFPFQENNNIFFKYQDDNDIESLLNDPNFLDFNLIPDNPQWHSNELLVSTNQPPDHKEQVQQVSNENERYESDVFNEIVSLAQNHNPIKNVHTSSLEYNEQTTENKDSNLIPEEIDYRNIQYDDYYFHGIPNFQNHYNRKKTNKKKGYREDLP